MHKRERDIYRMTDQDSSSSTRPLADQESPFRTLGGGGGIPSKKFRLRLKSRRILLSYAPLNVLKPTCLHKGCSYFFTFKQICIFPPISDTAEEQFAPDAPTPPLISKCTRHEPSGKHTISH